MDEASGAEIGQNPVSATASQQTGEMEAGADSRDERVNTYGRRKRKGDFEGRGPLQQGARSGRNDGKRHKKGDMGREQYFSSQLDKRKRNEEAQAKRQRDGVAVSGQGIAFSKEEIDAEERRPKRKVAVLIGYSGTGYKGMQISDHEHTIEGDLFQAFVKAGAISKANAEDPKKSSLVRCARTDKGVHAAGNMISLKLIVEDDDIVEKINAVLSPQIRIWGIERTINSFSCYQACDSRWYEYLIPSHAFLPPHPSSWLAKQTETIADEAGDRAGYEERQADVKGFWESVDKNDINAILETIDEDIRWEVIKALQGEDEANAKAATFDADIDASSERPQKPTGDEGNSTEAQVSSETANAAVEVPLEEQPAQALATGISEAANKKDSESSKTLPGETSETTTEPLDAEAQRTIRLRAATKRLRNAYIAARRRYRIPVSRIQRIQDALTKYVGTNNFHNYTIQKTFNDPSAKRHIKSFVVNTRPILIGNGPDDDEKTEWLSLKVHGQSFMMHQIRKMIGMIALLVRCGGKLEVMDDSFTASRYSIPKVPGLGLLLERPVFDTYNNSQAVKHGREKLNFGKYEAELEAFKEREIYQRIFREEEERNEFGRFFNHIDNFKDPYFLYVTSKGLGACKGHVREIPGERAETSLDLEA